VESADRESRRLDILSVKKEANLSAREVGEVEVGIRCAVSSVIHTRNSSGDEIAKRDFSVYLFILQLYIV